MRTWHILGTLAAILFLAGTLMLHSAPEAIAVLDDAAAALVAPLQASAGLAFFLAMTALGGGAGIAAAAGGFGWGARLSMPRGPRRAALLAAPAVACRFLKELFERMRPEPLPWFDVLTTASYPSAHAASAMALYGFIAVVLYSRTKRAAFAFIPLAAVLLVGMSRVVLNAHYVSDVAAGYLLGIVMLSLAFALPFERLAERYG